MSKRISKTPRILFITSTYLGDAIISTTVLESINQEYPNAKITIACGAIAAPIFEDVPNLEELYIIRKQKFGLHTLKLWWKFFFKKWDYVLDLRGTGLSYFLIKKRHLVWRSTKNISELRVKQIAKLLGKSTPDFCKVYVGDQHHQTAKNLLPSSRPLLLLSPLASWDKKCWPAENFITLARELTANDGLLPGAAIAFLGDAKQRPQLLAMLEQFPKEQQIDMSGNVELLTLAACLEKANLFVGNDSGLMHLAAAMGTPTLGLFGPSRTEVYAPFGPHAHFVRAPLSYDDMMLSAQQGHAVMHLLRLEDVLKACITLLQKSVKVADR